MIRRLIKRDWHHAACVMSVLIVLFDCYQILQAFELLRRVYIHQFLRHFGSHILDNVRMLAENMASASFFRQMEQFVKLYPVEENRASDGG